MSLISIIRKKQKYPSDNIELAHAIWYGMYSLSFGTANGLLAINGVRGLYGLIETPESGLQIVAYTSSLISMISIGIMVQLDELLFKTIYPIRVWQFHRLKRIRNHICLAIKSRTIMPELIKSHNLDNRLHDTIILILDYYPYLDEDDLLREQLWEIEKSAHNLEDIVWKIMQLKTKISSTS